MLDLCGKYFVTSGHSVFLFSYVQCMRLVKWYTKLLNSRKGQLINDLTSALCQILRYCQQFMVEVLLQLRLLL